jgi:hypothetical protein
VLAGLSGVGSWGSGLAVQDGPSPVMLSAESCSHECPNKLTVGPAAGWNLPPLFVCLITGLLDNIRHCCPVDGPSQTQ